MISIVPFIFGAVLGSFLNVCIYRVPLGISVVFPPSRCPSCARHIPFYYNIPILSYVLLRGRCAFCGLPFSIKYPVVEAATGLAASAVFLRFGLSVEFFVYLAFVSALIVITFIDLEHRIIPDAISLPGIAVGFVASFFTDWPGVADSLIGLVVGGGVLFAVAAAYFFIAGHEGMGGGDIKLLAMIGAFLGWKGVVLTLLAGSFSGAVIGSAFMLAFGKDRRFQIPFGPFLAGGALLYLFFGDPLIAWYLNRAFGG